jgi:hypothetical protein
VIASPMVRGLVNSGIMKMKLSLGSSLHAFMNSFDS